MNTLYETIPADPREVCEIPAEDYKIEIHHDPYPRNPAAEFDCYGPEEVEDWKNGDVFGWVIVRADGSETVEYSCWGYYGAPDSDGWNYMVESAREQIAYLRERDKKEREEVSYWAARDVVTASA